MKKIPLRRCVVTKEQLPKKELLRIVRDKDGNVFPDITGKANGRGAYIKKDLNTLNIAYMKYLLLNQQQLVYLPLLLHLLTFLKHY